MSKPDPAQHGRCKNPDRNDDDRRDLAARTLPDAELAMMSGSSRAFPFRLNRNGGAASLFDTFSSREPVSASLENALDDPPRRSLKASSLKLALGFGTIETERIKR
jgi:hypothetical protein